MWMTFQLKVITLASLLVFSGLMELKIFAQETDNKKGWVSPLTKIQFLKIPAGSFLMVSNNGKILRDKEIKESGVSLNTTMKTRPASLETWKAI